MALVPDLTMWIFDHNVYTQTSPQTVTVVSVASWLLSMVSAWPAPPTPGTPELSLSFSHLPVLPPHLQGQVASARIISCSSPLGLALHQTC